MVVVQKEIPPQLRLKYLWIKKLCYLLDEGIKLPFINYRIGLDPILGLYLGVGDAISLGISLYTLYLMSSFGIPKKTLFRMLLDLGIDFGIGLIPIYGQGADFFYKPNIRNWKRFEKHFFQP